MVDERRPHRLLQLIRARPRLGVPSGKLNHMGIRGKVARSTPADANERHDWRISDHSS
ncbi:MAG: hypothetical protein JNN08_01505 [Bryobacterales bacterium]|nr:hypothetical protein [Bryobacterales bacterium]